MLGVDTNVLVRFLVRDDTEQYDLAARLIANSPNGGLFIDPIVIVELNWVLRRVYDYPRDDVLGVLHGLMDSKEFEIGERSTVLSAIDLATSTGADVSDGLIALLNEKMGCERTVTFDKKALRLSQMVQVEKCL